MKRDRRNDYVGDPTRQCFGKVRFTSKKVAKQHLRRHRKRSPGLSVYRCPWCTTFHIGHGPA